MRRALSLSVAIVLCGGLAAVPVFAQAQPQVVVTHEMTNQDLNLAELQAFDQVAIANRKRARQLAANPHLATSNSFLAKWRDLNNFFAKYPGSKERFLADPGNYLSDVHMHNGHLVIAAHKKKPATEEKKPAATASEAAPASAPAPAAPAPAPAAPAPAAPSSNP